MHERNVTLFMRFVYKKVLEYNPWIFQFQVDARYEIINIYRYMEC